MRSLLDLISQFDRLTFDRNLNLKKLAFEREAYK